MAKLVSKTYGEALFELALESNALDSTAQEVANIKEAIAQNDELIKLLNHPKIIKEEKISLIEKIFKDKVSDIITGLLVTIVEKDRYNEMDSIFDYFLGKVDEYNHIGTAYVTSAVELSDEQKVSIEKRLIKCTSYVKFKMNYTIDKNIIGGLIIRIGDRVVDNSIRTKIDSMSKDLSKLQIL